MSKIKEVHVVKWHVPVVKEGLRSYVTEEHTVTFKHKRTAVRFRNQLINAYNFINIQDASSYIRMTSEEIF